jgi:hypothetical protein
MSYSGHEYGAGKDKHNANPDTPHRLGFPWSRLAHGLLAISAPAIIWIAIRFGIPNLAVSPLQDLLAQHGLALIGLPVAFFTATTVICGLRAIEGTFHMQFAGLAANGATAVLFGWLIVFGAAVASIRFLWSP